MRNFRKIVIFCLTLLVVTMVHELSHAIVAVLLGVNVTSINIGYQLPPILSVPIGGITLNLSPYLIMASVSVEGAGQFTIPWWKEALIVLVGPFSSLMFGILAIWILKSRQLAWGAFKDFIRFWRIFTALLPKKDPEAQEKGKLVGPIGIFKHYADEIDRQGLLSILSIGGLLSIGFYLINLLPLPPLDGGFFLLDVISGITGGSQLFIDIAGIVMRLGGAILMTIVTIVTWKDIGRMRSTTEN